MISPANQANKRKYSQNRRNSSLELRQGAQGKYIRKYYHRRFQVEQEYQAYLAIDSVIENVNGIRRAEVYGIDCRQNLIDIEFIDGPTLAEDFLEHGVLALEARIDCLLSLFYEARKQQVQFDSDPSNLMYDLSNNTLVLIDPVCEQMDIADYGMIVFLWGLLKCFFRAQRFAQVVRGQGFASVLGFRRFWQDINRGYQEKCQVSPREMNRQMCVYIDRVIGWNRTENQNEVLGRRLLRQICLIPSYKIIQMGFKRQWLIPGFIK